MSSAHGKIQELTLEARQGKGRKSKDYTIVILLKKFFPEQQKKIRTQMPYNQRALSKAKTEKKPRAFIRQDMGVSFAKPNVT